MIDHSHHSYDGQNDCQNY